MTEPNSNKAEMNNENKVNAGKDTSEPSSTNSVPKKKIVEKKKKGPVSGHAGSSMASMNQQQQGGFPYYPPVPHAYMNPYGHPGMGMMPPQFHHKGGPSGAAAAAAAAAAAHYSHPPHHAYGYPHPYQMAPHPYYPYPPPPPPPYAAMTQGINNHGQSGYQKQTKGSKKSKVKRNSTGTSSSSTAPPAPPTQPANSGMTNIQALKQRSGASTMSQSMTPHPSHQYFMGHPTMQMHHPQSHQGLQMAPPPPAGNGRPSLTTQQPQQHGMQRHTKEGDLTASDMKSLRRSTSSKDEGGPSQHFQMPPPERRPSAASPPTHASIAALTTSTSPGHWTKQEDDMLRSLVEEHGNANWKIVATFLPGRSESACQNRWQKVLKVGLTRGPWTDDEDKKLMQLVDTFGPRKWSAIAEELSGRSGKQCRERWHNHLNPSLKRKAWSDAEDRQILECHMRMGNRWAEMSKYLPGR